MTTPLVSILIPCYNVADFLDKCIESVTTQTYHNLQIVIIDDGSTDSTWEVMKKHASIDSRIEIYHQINQGVAATRNALLKKIKGDYVLFIDSDDWIEKEMVEYLLNALITYSGDVATCGMVFNDSIPQKKYNQKILTQKETIKTFLFHKKLRGSLCDKLIKTDLLSGLYFNKDISYGEDALFCWGFLQRVDKVLLTTRQLYHYRMNNESISHQTFGEKKLTGHEVWRIINEETSKYFPEYLDIARARWGIESMYLLRQAGQSNYKKDSSIRILQNTLYKNIIKMAECGLLSIKEFINACIMSKCYNYCLIYPNLYKIKSHLCFHK